MVTGGGEKLPPGPALWSRSSQGAGRTGGRKAQATTPRPGWGVRVPGGRGAAAGGGLVGAAARPGSPGGRAEPRPPRQRGSGRGSRGRGPGGERTRLGAYHGEAAGGAHHALAPLGLGLRPREAELGPLRTCCP